MVQLGFTPEIEVFRMVVYRSLPIFTVTSIMYQIAYIIFQFPEYNSVGQPCTTALQGSSFQFFLQGGGGKPNRAEDEEETAAAAAAEAADCGGASRRTSRTSRAGSSGRCSSATSSSGTTRRDS